MNWYLKVLKQYADFNGRARRTEFWMFVLINLAIYFILGLIFTIFSALFRNNIVVLNVIFSLIYSIYSLAVLIPSFAVSVRRLHDVGKSGWMLLIGIIPVIGWIWLFVLMVSDSQPGENEYGINPKEVILA